MSFLSEKQSMRRNTIYPSGNEMLQSMDGKMNMTSETYATYRANKQIHEARWAPHRKKIGLLKKNEFNPQDTKAMFDYMKDELVKFTLENFTQKECIKFVPKKKSKSKIGEPIKCYCGAPPEKHHHDAAGIKHFFDTGAETVRKMLENGAITEKWSESIHIHKYPTSAFGKIDFQYEELGGKKPSKYLRLSDDTPVDKVLKFFDEHWHMNLQQANLVITVIGGAKNFRLDGRRKEVFNRGLVNAAQTTNAWIVTSGFNMGVMRAVGEAVAEAQSYTFDKNGMTHRLKCIGIAPWGYVLNNEALVNSKGKGSWNASYKPSKVIEHGSTVSLNPHHTHFLLVDDGYRGKYGGVADFRARLESKLATPDKGHGIPVVLILVEGGFDAILDVSRSIEAKIPCVICEGTGRAADILSYAYLHYVTNRDQERVIKEKHRHILKDKLLVAYGKTWKERSDENEEANKFLDIVLKCCKDENLITVFDMNKNEELDVAILSALLKGQGAKNLKQLHDQLKLALTWNRTDIAEDDIFTQNVIWPADSLNEIMTDALVDGKIGFVRLLLQNGLIMDEYLTAPRLRVLYNKAPKVHRLRQLLKNTTKVIALSHIGSLLQDLLDKYDCAVYKEDTDIKAIERNTGVSIGTGKDKLNNPFKELFLWAILVNRQDLAKFFWEHGNEAIPSALAATKIYDSMAKRLAHYDSDLKNIYLKNKDEFECLAIKVLDECHDIDHEKAAVLIEQKYKNWGNINCLEMAALAEDKKFLSTACCQNSLALMWKRGISSHSALVSLCILFPPLIFVVIKFQGFEESNNKLTAKQKFLTFFQAPVTKFAAHLMMYMVFLILYSYMLLFGYKEHVTATEWAVIAWLITITAEELREMMFNSLADNLKQRMYLWWSFSSFNVVNGVLIILNVLAIILRFISGIPVVYAKNVYSIMGVFLFIRVLREYSASSSLGPKLVMINQMLKELILFMMILLVFLLAYGISSQALMHPFRDFSPIIFRDILYYPYWQVYGELYLDELEGRTDDCRDSTINADGYPCPTFSWLVVIFTAGYLLVGNLLLLNILIAIFNNVFTEIQANSIEVWKYGIYFLVVVNDNKPALAPPFIIFQHVYMILKWICKRTCCKGSETDEFSGDRNYEFTLKIFEKECVKQTICKEQISQEEVLPKKLAVIYNRVDEMAKILEEEHLLEQQRFEAEQNKKEQGGYSNRRLLQSQSSTVSMNTSCSESELTKLSRSGSFSRWPSLATLRDLRKKMESIEETKTVRESDEDTTVLEKKPRYYLSSSEQDLYRKENEEVESPPLKLEGPENVEMGSEQDHRSVDTKRHSKVDKWMKKQYEQLIESESDDGHVIGSSGGMLELPEHQIQMTVGKLESKMDGIDQRLNKMEESMQNLGTLLRIAISQRSSHEPGREPSTRRHESRWAETTSHMPSVPISVAPTMPPLPTYHRTDDADYALQVLSPQLPENRMSSLHRRPGESSHQQMLGVNAASAPPNIPPRNSNQSLLKVNAIHGPPTEPPNDPFQNFEGDS